MARQRDQQPFALVAPFIRASLIISLCAGFGLGAALVMALALGAPLGSWWPTLVLLHGRGQLVGFVGLFTVAVGLHFLPRLRGAPLAFPRLARVGLLLLSVGLATWGIAQAVTAFVPATEPSAAMGTALGSLLEWLGATLALLALVQTLLHGPSITTRGGLTSVLPFLAFGFSAFWCALGTEAVLRVGLARVPSVTLAAHVDDALVDALVFGFALPITMGVSTRLLPIYIWRGPRSTPYPHTSVCTACHRRRARRGTVVRDWFRVAWRREYALPGRLRRAGWRA